MPDSVQTISPFLSPGEAGAPYVGDDGWGYVEPSWWNNRRYLEPGLLISSQNDLLRERYRLENDPYIELNAERDGGGRITYCMDSETVEYFDSKVGSPYETGLFHTLEDVLLRPLAVFDQSEDGLAEHPIASKELREIQTTIFSYFEYYATHQDEELALSQSSEFNVHLAQLRRTALYLYKVLRIPPVNIWTDGDNKLAYGPFGREYDDELDYQDKVMNLVTGNGIGNTANWDGRINAKPEIPLFSKEGQRQQVRSIVRTPPDSEENSEPKSLLHDIDVVRSLSHVLPVSHKVHLPIIYKGSGEKTIRLEYLPAPVFASYMFPGEDRVEKAKFVLELATFLSVVNENGYFWTDIKSDNIKRRVNGEWVVFDCGSFYGPLEEGEHTSAIKNLAAPGGYAQPIEFFLTTDSETDIDLGKMEVFELAGLLAASVFGSERVGIAITKHPEFERTWEGKAIDSKGLLSPAVIDTIKDDPHFDPYYPSPSNEVFDFIKAGLQPDPQRRMTMPQFVEGLKKILKDPNAIKYDDLQP